MAIKRPGTTSNITFFITTFWALVMITTLVAGHLVLGFLIYSNITDGGGMKAISEFVSLPTWLLWLSIVAALALDGWILYHKRQERLKALKR